MKSLIITSSFYIFYQLQNNMLLMQKNGNNEQMCTLHRHVHSIVHTLMYSTLYTKLAIYFHPNLIIYAKRRLLLRVRSVDITHRTQHGGQHSCGSGEGFCLDQFYKINSCCRSLFVSSTVFSAHLPCRMHVKLPFPSSTCSKCPQQCSNCHIS